VLFQIGVKPFLDVSIIDDKENGWLYSEKQKPMLMKQNFFAKRPFLISSSFLKAFDTHKMSLFFVNNSNQA